MDAIRLIWLKIHWLHSDAEKEKGWLSLQRAQGQRGGQLPPAPKEFMPMAGETALSSTETPQQLLSKACTTAPGKEYT